MKGLAWSLAILGLTLSATAAAEGTLECKMKPHKAEAAAEALAAAYAADHAERDRGEPDTRKQDAKRVKQAQKIDKKGGICTPEAAYHAAWILRRGDTQAQMERAHALARVAMGARIERGAWLSAITFDRLQLATGHPQRFGTQMRSDSERTCLFPVALDISDEERAQYQIQPLEETFKGVLERNQLAGAAPVAASLDRHKLWCEMAAW